MWYFKESSALNGVSPKGNQLKRLKKFQQELRDSGVYYATFRSAARFRDLVDQHLINCLCERIGRRERASAQDLTQSVAELELMQKQIHTEAGNFSMTAVQIASSFRKLQITSEETDSRIQSIIEEEDEASHYLIGSVFERLRLGLEAFTADIEGHCPKLGESFDKFTWASMRLLTVASKLDLPNIKFMLTFIQSQITPFHKAVQDGVSINSHLQTVLAMYPTVSSDFQEAQNKTHQALELLIEEYRSIERASGAMIELVQSTVEKNVS